MPYSFKDRKILFCVPETIPSYAGGGRNAFNYARYLARNNEEVSLLVLNRNFKLSGKQIIEGVTVNRIPYLAFNFFTKFISLFAIIPAYSYFVMKYDIIFIYSSFIIGYQFIILLAALGKKKVVFRSTLFNNDDIKSILNRGNLLRRLNKFALNNISAYYSINPFFSNSYREMFNAEEKIVELPQGIDENFFFTVNGKEKEKLRYKLNLPLNKTIIISAGYLIERKGFRDIFKVLSGLDEDFIYIVIGDYKPSEVHYQKKEEIKEMIKLYELGKSKLKDKIYFIGGVNNIDEYFKASDIFIHNCNGEFPNVLLEAMSSSLAVLFKRQDIDYIIQHKKNGFIYNNLDEMYLYLKKCINDPELRRQLGKRANKTVLENYTFGKIHEAICLKCS